MTKQTGEVLGWLVLVVVILIVMGGSISWSAYKYKDCIKVGHSKAYCIATSIFR